MAYWAKGSAASLSGAFLAGSFRIIGRPANDVCHLGCRLAPESRTLAPNLRKQRRTLSATEMDIAKI